LRAVSYTATQTQVLLSYRAGLFPMGVGIGGTGRVGGRAPRRRGVLLPGDLRVTKSLRKSMKHFTYTSDRAVQQVIRADRRPTRFLLPYRAGLCAMGVGIGGTGRMGWWAPRRRGVLLPGDLRVPKSLRKSMKHFTFTSDRAFEQVIRACADPNRPGAWITE